MQAKLVGDGSPATPSWSLQDVQSMPKKQGGDDLGLRSLLTLSPGTCIPQTPRFLPSFVSEPWGQEQWDVHLLCTHRLWSPRGLFALWDTAHLGFELFWQEKKIKSPKTPTSIFVTFHGR